MRVRILVVTIQSLLLLTSSYAQENDQKSKWSEIYVYDVFQSVKVYLCSSTTMNHQCYDRAWLFHNNYTLYIESQHYCGQLQKICEITSFLNILDLVTSSDISGNTYNYETVIFWLYSDLCLNLKYSYTGTNLVKFEGQTPISVQYGTSTLQLTEKKELCGLELWTTSHHKIAIYIPKISNKENINVRNVSIKPTNNDSTPLNHSASDVSKKWYVYTYPIDVTVYYYIKYNSVPCTDLKMLNIAEDVQDTLEKCSKIFNSSCNHYEVCKKIHEVNLEKDKITDLNERCKYSSGFCKEPSSFWKPIDRCSFKKIHEGFTNKNSNGAIDIKINDSRTITSLRRTKLCKNDVYITYDKGTVISEKELQLSMISVNYEKELQMPVTQNRSKLFYKLIVEQNEKIKTLQSMLNYTMFLVLLGVFWYIFTVIVNFLTLRKLNKNLKRKTSLLNCLCESLTVRQIFFSQRNRGKGSTVTVNVENELYSQ